MKKSIALLLCTALTAGMLVGCGSTAEDTAEAPATEEATDAKKLLAWQGGFLARCEGSTLTFTDCTWGNTASLDDERDTDNHRIGGLAAEVMGGCTVTVSNTTLSGSITSASQSNANVGGLIAVSRGEDSNNKANSSTIKISELSVKGETVTTSLATTTSGGWATSGRIRMLSLLRMPE